MQFLLDQGLPRSAVRELAIRGLSASHVGDLGLAAATDAEILETARVMGAVVVTLDADFHALLAHSAAVEPSVIRIRIEGLKGDDVADLVAQAVATAGDDLTAGAAVSIQRDAIRVRRLPLV